MKKIFFMLMICILTLNLGAQETRYSGLISDDDYDYFWSLVTGYFENEGLTIIENRNEGLIQLGEPASDAEESHPLRYFPDMQFSMDNLLLQCLNLNKSSWPDEVSGYFGQIIKTAELEKEIGDKLDIFSFAESYLKLRLYPYEYKDYMETIIHREDIPQVFSAAVFDFPTSVRMVDSAYLEKWGKTADEVMEIALENCLNEVETVHEQFELVPGVLITAFFSDSIFTTTDVYRLHEMEELLGRYGTIVAIPTRDVFIVFPIESNEDSIMSAVQLAFMAQGMYADGPGSVSPGLYWYYDGEFELIEHDPEKGMILFPERYRNLFENGE